MAAPLQYKRRVRLPEADEPALPRARRSLALPVGLAAWLASVGFAWGVKAGTIPVASWLDAGGDEPPRARVVRPRAPQLEPIVPPALEPLVPVAIPQEPEPVATTAVAMASTAATPEEPRPAPALRPPAGAPALPEPTLALTPQPPADLPPYEPSVPTATRPPPASPEPPSAPAAGGATVGTSCEAAAAAYADEIVMGADRGPADLTREDYAAVLNRGSWFASCGVPDHVTLDVCVAVQNGRARGVTVHATPRHAAVESCVARAASRIAFPSHPRLDVARTRFVAR